MRRWFLDNFFMVMIVLAIIFSVLGVWAIHEDEVRWQKFKATHDCRIVAETEATSVLVSGPKGVHVGIQPGTQTFLCDDGVRYTRNKQ